MNPNAEVAPESTPTPAPVSPEAIETQNVSEQINSPEQFVIPEQSQEIRESAAHAAAMLAINESAAREDWSQDRLDTVVAQAEAQAPAPVEAPAPVASEAVESEEGQELVAAITAAEQAEPTHTVAAAALDAEKSRQIFAVEQAASRDGWSQERIDAALAEVNRQ